ncbi:MAG: RNA methyltransferase [Patescibacteria group bacterium]
MHIITSASNGLIKEVLRLKKSVNRKKQDLIIVDGIREISMAVKSGWSVVSLYYSESLGSKAGQSGFLGIPGEKTVSVTEEVFKKISFKENPDGYLATFQSREASLNDIRLGENPLLIVLEDVEKPGNLGAIIRTAAAVGADGVIVNDAQTDPFNPNVIRASEGEIFSVTLVKSSLKETISWLRDKQISCLAATTDGREDYSKADLTGPVALVFGSEAHGLSGKWLEQADKKIIIPMVGDIDSLNVSVAVAVIAFEVLRQRRNRLAGGHI